MTRPGGQKRSPPGLPPAPAHRVARPPDARAPPRPRRDLRPGHRRAARPRHRPARRFSAAIGLFAAGYFMWTLAEYWIHRVVFHFEPEDGWGAKVHFLIHGVHHEHPNDPLRLVMPPLASLPLAIGFALLYRWVFGGDLWMPVTAGFIAGYVIYDEVHYLLHHYVPTNPIGRRLRELHMRHHFQDDTRGFGISAPYWDRCSARTSATEAPLVTLRASPERPTPEPRRACSHPRRSGSSSSRRCRRPAVRGGVIALALALVGGGPRVRAHLLAVVAAIVAAARRPPVRMRPVPLRGPRGRDRPAPRHPRSRRARSSPWSASSTSTRAARPSRATSASPPSCSTRRPEPRDPRAARGRRRGHPRPDHRPRAGTGGPVGDEGPRGRPRSAAHAAAHASRRHPHRGAPQPARGRDPARHRHRRRRRRGQPAPR